MYKLLLLYRSPTDGQFFNEDHYHKIHLGEALKFAGKYGCRRLEIARALPMEQQRSGRSVNFYRTTELWFDTYDDLIRCITSPEMTALNPDARNYTNVSTEGEYLEAEVYTFNEAGEFAGVTGAWESYFAPKIGTDMGPLVYGRAEPSE